ncbi:uncharacterized protein LOC119736853 [Patiria miniata]|uniref:Farnesoic acid O-methyl transferase domain-containing protein n=1 Tax=Patiria miniata TaxID=46514 RepID=A0A914ATZ8_PATMI|nr:uncharacterized protein LOC119736853 [Patiria miniata]
MPFRLEFEVKTESGAAIALAEDKTDESLFAEIRIGGDWNRKVLVRPCYYLTCPHILAEHIEAGLVDANEYRPFWIDYKGGVDKVGKGGQEEAFLEWDAGAYHQRVATQVHVACSFSTVAANPHTFKFILKPLSIPFRLDFTVKTDKDAALALAESTTRESIFAEMNIGGGSGNARTVMRSCYYLECPDVVSLHKEEGLVNANEYRPFWIDYKGGVVRVGKGGQEEAFLEWDAGAHHQRVATQVRIGIASWASTNGDWVFYKFCE